MSKRGQSLFIALTKNELGECRTVSESRTKYNNDRNIQNQIASKSKIDPSHAGYIGCVGELAVSLVMGLPRNMEPFARYDVGNFQVRTIDAAYKSLVIKIGSKDNPEDIFIGALLLNEMQVKVYGWAYGHEIQEKGTKREGYGTFSFYGLEQNKTRPMIDLFLEGPWWPTERAKFDYELVLAES